jgi:hypothetical protein
MDLVGETTDPVIDTVKLELFGVDGRAPIVASDHPVMKEMLALPAPAKDSMHPSSASTRTAGR